MAAEKNLLNTLQSPTLCYHGWTLGMEATFSYLSGMFYFVDGVRFVVQNSAAHCEECEPPTMLSLEIIHKREPN